ncbi:hypothetical protein CHUAL_010325 [Chamberlinius hualienensis]
MNSLRGEVLSCFRRLHRTRRLIFRGDQFALQATRKRINDEFRGSMLETDSEVIKEKIKLGNEVETLLRTQVIQASLKSDGIIYELRPNKETQMTDTLPEK